MGLKGWKQSVFIIGGTAAVTAIGALLGHYAGKALVSLYAKGGLSLNNSTQLSQKLSGNIQVPL